MEFHREMAGRQAMGNTTLAAEDARAVWLLPWIESFWQDLAYGFRTMRRQKAFTLTALAALASAIGLNTSLFTAFHAIALRPWPVRNPERVVNVNRLLLKGPERGRTSGFAIAEYRYLAEHAKSFDGLIVMREGETVHVDERRLSVTMVSGNYFSVLGVEMARGRGFLTEEDRAGAPQAVAVMSFATWQNRFGGDPAMLGKTLRLDDVPFTVVGVAARDFTGTAPMRSDLWMPFPARALLRPHDPSVIPFLTSPDYCCSSVAGRLAGGVTRGQATSELEVLLRQVQGKGQVQRDTPLVLSGTAWLERPDGKREKVFPIMGLMFLAMTLVLLLACANVGNLLLARAAARRREMGVRLSLGGSRLRLVRQLLVESFSLAATAAAIGLAVACFLPGYIATRLEPGLSFHLMPDASVAAYTVLLAVVTCVAFGLAPALAGTRGQIAVAMRGESRLESIRLPLRSMLLAVQVAVSVILLTGAGLLVRSLQRAQHQDPGFEIERVSVVSLELPASAYGGPRTAAFARQLQTELERAEGLPQSGLSMDAPMANGRSWTTLRPSGAAADAEKMVQFHEVSGGYFDVLGIPLVAGRNFTRDDAGRTVAIVNETAARRFWQGANAVGQTIVSSGKTWEIMGVAKDAYTTDLSGIEPTMYWPMAGRFNVPLILLRDSNAGGMEHMAALVARIEPRARVTAVPPGQNFRDQLAPAKRGAALAGGLGILALVLAGVGMAGVFAYVVRQRTREIGVRMALGAQPSQVVRLVLGANLRALAAGMALGIAGALAIARLLRHELHGVSPLDPLAHGLGLLLLLVVAAAAGVAPARRAVKVDPVSALRWE